MTGPTPPILASVRLPEGGTEVELPPANKFSIAWQGDSPGATLSPPVASGGLSDSEGEGKGVSEDESVPTPRRHPVERVVVEHGSLQVPRLSRAFSAPVAAQIGQLANPRRKSGLKDMSGLGEVSGEVADSVEMAIATLLAISPPQVLDPAKEQFSACSLPVPTPSVAALLTQLKNLNYIAQHIHALAQPNDDHPQQASPVDGHDFDIGETVQSVGDALAGLAAEAGVELVIFHADNGMKHVAVHADETAVAYTLQHVCRQIIGASSKGDTLELGLFLVAPLAGGSVYMPTLDATDAPASGSPEPDPDAPLHCTFQLTHHAQQPDQPPPALNGPILRRLLRDVGATLTGDGRTWKMNLTLPRGDPTVVNAAVVFPDGQDMFPDLRIPGEPTLADLAAFTETLKGKRVLLYASASALFARHLTSHLTSWGLDVSPVSRDSSSPERASENAAFVLIDDDVPALRARLRAARAEAQYPLHLAAGRKRPNLSAHHRPRSSPQIARAMTSAAPAPQRHPPPVIIHFSSLANFKNAKGAVHTLLSPFATTSGAGPYLGRIPEVIILPKPAGPRRVLTALHTAATKPAVDPFFSPIATSPMSPGLALYTPRSPVPTRNSPARSPLNDSSHGSSSGSGSGSNPNVTTTGSGPGGVSPLKLSEGMDYFSEAAVKLGTSPSSGLVIQSPDGQPAGIFFHPRLKGVQRGSSLGVGIERRNSGEGGEGMPGFGTFGLPPTLMRRDGSGQGSVRDGTRSREGSRDGRDAARELARRSSSRPAPSPATPAPALPSPAQKIVDVSVTAPTPPVPGTETDLRRKRLSGRSPTAPATPLGLGLTGTQIVAEPGPLSPTALRKVSPIDALRKATPPASPSPSGGVGFVRRRGSGMRSPIDGVSTQGAEGTPPPSATVPRKRATKKPDSGIVPPINVLVVEDNPINQTILTTFMRRKKIKFDVAKNGEEAVNKWKSGQFHLILMDIQMPVMDGITATTEIRRLERLNAAAGYPSTPSASSDSSHPRTPGTPLTSAASASPYRSSVIIVALTASSLQSDRVAALAAGCNDFLTKPVSLDWLNSKIIEWGSIKALQMWADIKPETARGFAKGMAGQAQNVARRLRVPEGRATPSPTGDGQRQRQASNEPRERQPSAGSRERQPSAGSRDNERERERKTSAGTLDREKDTASPATPVAAVFGAQVLRHAPGGGREMSAAQEAAQALASGAPLLSRASSSHAPSPPNAGTASKQPVQASAPMRALAAMREPEAESTAHEAFEPVLAEVPEIVPEPKAEDATVDMDPASGVVSATEALAGPLDDPPPIEEAVVATEVAPASGEDVEAPRPEESTPTDTEDTPLLEDSSREADPGPVG
ncbi:hypothetical protein PENSPDRAFT_681291 [Peniophora sp. CONT]|nr:hypothetical protein PENSPDRAFT_681291 [Peniophora sp. CONT]